MADAPRVISFGCLGTLVDRDRGLDDALREHLGVEAEPQRVALIGAQRDAEWELIEGLETWRPFREILRDSLVVAGRRFGVPIAQARAEAVAATVGAWPLFDDVPGALAELAPRAPLALLPELEGPDLGRVLERLPVSFAHVVPAERVEAFRPEPDPWMALLHEMQLDEEELLHVASDVSEELFTTTDLGIPSVFINRAGGAPAEDVAYRFELSSMKALPARLYGSRTRRGSRGRPRGRRGKDR
jgi:2-haloacid dehalogenase